jgi:hypothetical protein
LRRRVREGIVRSLKPAAERLNHFQKSRRSKKNFQKSHFG